MTTIVIVEDDENLSRGIAFALERDGYSVVSAATASEGASCCQRHDPDLVILDLGLPDRDGLELCRSIRARSGVPIMMLTARDLETDEVQGLMSGADDYVTKPFSLSVLRARVEALLRRADPTGSQVIRSGRFELDVDRCRLRRDGQDVPISATEFRLLRCLMANQGRVLTREQLLALWDTDARHLDENTLAVNISRLRAKVESDPRAPRAIKTIHGVGYVWVKG